ncbi:MAG: RluA family pseudouridine synthase [Actinomycetota bacterium]|jgi:23S rRNA pseudouridine1911/1915/1917 synthase|nr:RluA family pseudouridine synthase [Actinomycetota bacterium]
MPDRGRPDPEHTTLTDTVPAAMAGERIDRVVALMTDLSRSAVRRLIEAGHVRLDGVVAGAASARVEQGAGIEVEMPERAETEVALPANPAVEFVVVYEDDHVVVIDKPIDLVVHPGAGRENNTLANGLVHRYPDVVGVGEPDRPGIVHRLDRDTSGLLVCARTPQAHDDLVSQLVVHSVARVYLTLVRGIADAPSGVIDAPIGRSRRARTRMTISEDGKDARTHYETLETFTRPVESSLLRCRLETGRTHQIRVHLQAVGLHVLGDATYGRPDPFGIGRPLLHAAELAFDHPSTGERVSFTSPLPPDFAGALDQLRAETAEAVEQLEGLAGSGEDQGS